MITPGEHQLEIVRRFSGLPYCLIGDSMGTGKTLSGVLLDLEERKWHDGRSGEPFRTLIVCTKGGLSVWKWHLEDQGVAAGRILVIDPSNRTPFDQELLGGALNYDYYVLHYHALPLMSFFKRVQVGSRALVWDHIIADECLRGDTCITTPMGDRPIEVIRPGDLVLGRNDKTGKVCWTRVKAVSRRWTTEPLYHLDDLVGTGLHPVWTEEAGYVDLAALDAVSYTVLRLGHGASTEVASQLYS